MILFHLFFSFFKLGLFTFGGGAAMIPLLEQEVLSNGWLAQDELLSYIAISESTPGPIAINMATFVGSSQAGFLGALMATLGVVLPSFIIILLIASVFKRFSEYRAVRCILSAIRPIVVGMILAAGALLALSAVGIQGNQGDVIDYPSLVMTSILALVMILYPKITKKKIGVIPMILVAAVIGIIASFI